MIQTCVKKCLSIASESVSARWSGYKKGYILIMGIFTVRSVTKV